MVYPGFPHQPPETIGAQLAAIQEYVDTSNGLLQDQLLVLELSRAACRAEVYEERKNIFRVTLDGNLDLLGEAIRSLKQEAPYDFLVHDLLEGGYRNVQGVGFSWQTCSYIAHVGEDMHRPLYAGSQLRLTPRGFPSLTRTVSLYNSYAVLGTSKLPSYGVVPRALDIPPFSAR